MTWVKVCGLTRPDDVDDAEAAGADAVGFVLFPPSPRGVTPEEARALGKGAPLIRVAVTVDLTPVELLEAAAAAGVDGVQPTGANAAAAAQAASDFGYLVLRPVVVADTVDLDQIPSAQIPLLDSSHPELHGGTGTRFDWDLIGATDRRYVLAGGLNPDNIAAAVARLHPWGVDASSGLESAPGIKDAAKVEAFVAGAKGL